MRTLHHKNNGKSYDMCGTAFNFEDFDDDSLQVCENEWAALFCIYSRPLA